MALFSTDTGRYVFSSSHFQRNGDGDSDYEKSVSVYSFQPTESKVELEGFSKNAVIGRISENISESTLKSNTTVTTKTVSRMIHRNESKVIQSSRRQELRAKRTADEDSTKSISTTSVFNSDVQDCGRNESKKDMVENSAHNTSFYIPDSKESTRKIDSQSSVGDSSDFHNHRHYSPNTSVSNDERSSGLEEKRSTSSRFRSNAEYRRKIAGDFSSTKAQLARVLTSTEGTTHTGRETAFSSRSYSNLNASESTTRSGRRASENGSKSELHKSSVYRRPRSASEDWDKASVRTEDLGPQVTRNDVSSLGKVVDDLKVQSSLLERTVEDLKKKRSKSLGGSDEHEKPLQERRSSDVLLAADYSAIENKSDQNARKVNTKKQMYREIPARAEYVTATREASARLFKEGEYEWDDFPFKENTPSVDRDEISKNASPETGKAEIDQNGLKSTPARGFNISRDEKLSREETKTDGRVLKKTGVFEAESFTRIASDDANHVEGFLGKETILRKPGDTAEQSETGGRVWNKTEAFEGENSRKTGPVGANYLDERDRRSRHGASVTNHLTIRSDAHDLQNHVTISSAPIEKREMRVVKDGWVSKREVLVHSGSGDLSKMSVDSSESQIANPTVASKTSNMGISPEAMSERNHSTDLTMRERYFSRSQRIVPLPPDEVTKKEAVVDKREQEREIMITAKKDGAAGESDPRDDKGISKTSTESNRTTVTTEGKEKKNTSKSALWQKIEKLRKTVDSLNGLKSKTDLAEYVKQHPAKTADIEKRDKLIVQRYSMTGNRFTSKDLSSTDAPRDLEAMTLEELEMWQREKEITRERERQERQEELQRKKREIQLEREHFEKGLLVEWEREMNERREKLLSLEKKMKEAEREREVLQKKREADLEMERRRRQEEESRFKREREEQRRESIKLENEREDLRRQLERLKSEKGDREREVSRLEQERQEKLIVIEREKEASKLEWEKLDREKQRRESEVARIEREQERKIMLLQRENEATLLDREQLLKETTRIDLERREKVVLMEREREAARLERNKLESERRRREREVVSIERDLQQKMMLLHEEKEAAIFEREKLEMQAAKLDVERQQKLETLEKENKTARLERERLEREREEREKEGMKLEKKQQEKLAILQREIEVTRLERERLEEERREREAEAANMEILHQEKFLILEKEKEIVKLEREKIELERQEREREAVKEEEGRQIKFRLLEKEKEAVFLERERLEMDKEDAKREHRQVERQREAAKLDLERQQKMMSIERRRNTVEMEREQHEKMLSLQKEKEDTKREKEQLEQEKEIARKRLNELERLREFAEVEREEIERQKQALEKERETELLRRKERDLNTREERQMQASQKELEAERLMGEERDLSNSVETQKVVPIYEIQKNAESIEREQLQNAEIRRSDSIDAVTVITVDPQTNNKSADVHDAGVTYVEIDHAWKPRPLEKRSAHWWSASTAEDVDKILELGLPEWRTKAGNFDQLNGNDLRKPRRMNGIRRRSIRRKNGRPRGQEDDGVEVCVRVRGASNSSRFTATKQPPLENTIILRQPRESVNTPFVRAMRVDDKYGAGTVTLENGVVKITGIAGGKRRKAWSKAIKSVEKLSDSDGSHVISVNGMDTEMKNGTESTRAKVVPIRITTEPVEKSKTKRLKFVREFKRTGSFSKGRRGSAKKLQATGGKHKKGATAVSTVSGGNLTVSNSSKAHNVPVQTIQRVRRLYKTTNKASGWTYNGGRLEITVQPSPASLVKAEPHQFHDSMIEGGTTAEPEALVHSAHTPNGDKLRLGDHGNFAETRVWNMTRGTASNITRPITGNVRSAATFDEKFEVISDTGYNTLSDGEVGKNSHGRVEEISTREHSPTDGQWSTANTRKETVHSREKLPYSRKMSWAVGDAVTSKFLRRKAMYNGYSRCKEN